jgi:choice-of-anchor A domain-containing protein
MVSKGFLLTVALLPLLAISEAQASSILTGILSDASGYAVLFEGTGGHNLSITNVTINGNVGVGGTGAVQFSGPGTINGRVDFSAGNTGQFHNTNGSNIGPASVNFNRANVTTDLTNLNLFSSTIGAEAGTSITINGSQTIDASSGMLDANGNEVFTVTSYTEGNGNVLTINGNGHNIVLNLAVSGNPMLGGDVLLNNGLTSDAVLWNYTGTKNLSLNNNASSFPLPSAFRGIILAPNAAISLTNANLDGRVIVSGTTLDDPPPAQTAEPSSLTMLGFALAGLALLVRARQGALRPD